MNPDRTILIVGGKLKIARKARELGLDVIYFQKKDEYSAAHAEHVRMACLFDYTDVETAVELARSVHRRHPCRWAVTLTEPALLTAAAINDALGLPGNSHRTASLLMDKWAMRQHLRASGVSPVAAAVGAGQADIEAFAREHGLPLIVKPLDRNSSVGVVRIADLEEVGAAWAALRGQGFDRFVIEEYLDGAEVSVESFTFSGRHTIVAVTQKTTAGFVEMGHAVPAPLPEDARRELAACVRAFLDAVGLVEGPAHTEVKLTPAGPRVIESHNRVGGDRINELVEIAYGLDMDRLTLGWPFRLVPFVEDPGPAAAAAIRFVAPPPGRLLALAGVDAALRVEGVVEVDVGVSPGDEIPPLRSNFDRVGHVMARGTTVEEAVARCERARDLVRFEVEPAGAGAHA